jgi:hypothetical protein
MDVWLNKKTYGPDGTGPTLHAVVEYESHRLAAMARKRLIPGRVELWGRKLMVEWVTPRMFKTVSPPPP